MNPSRARRRFPEVAKREIAQARVRYRPRFWFFTSLARLLPDHTFVSLRTELLRQAGCDIAPGVAILGNLRILGGGASVAERLHIQTGAIIGPDVTFVLDAEVFVEENVSIGPWVVVTTGTHAIGFGSRRMNPTLQSRPVRIGRGTWVCGYGVILPGVTIGPASVVSAGAIVATDVPESVLVAGNPATIQNKLPFADR